MRLTKKKLQETVNRLKNIAEDCDNDELRAACDKLQNHVYTLEDDEDSSNPPGNPPPPPPGPGHG